MCGLTQSIYWSVRLGERFVTKAICVAWLFLSNCVLISTSAQSTALLDLDRTASQSAFPIAAGRQAAAIYIAPQNPETVRVAAEAFASDVERVTGARPRILTSLAVPLPANLIVVGVLGSTPEFERLRAAHRLVTRSTEG